MSDLNEVGERDGWRCWLCDEPVDPDASVNADRGPSVDSAGVAKGKKGAPCVERLAHRACNTRKGKIAPVVAWSPDLFVVDPAPIVPTVERGLVPEDFCEMEMEGLRPEIKSTSGLGIWPRNCRA